MLRCMEFSMLIAQRVGAQHASNTSNPCSLPPPAALAPLAISSVSSAQLTRRKLRRLIAQTAILAHLRPIIRAPPWACRLDLLSIPQLRISTTRSLAQAERLLHFWLLRLLLLCKDKPRRAARRHTFRTHLKRASGVRRTARAERHLSFGAEPGAVVDAVVLEAASAGPLTTNQA